MHVPALPARRIVLAHFGASGSFSEEAALEHARELGCAAELLPRRVARDVLRAVETGEAERAVLPVATSAGGLVRASLDALGGHALSWVGEVALAVRFALLARPGTALADVRAVASHPQAFRPCARTLARLLPGHRELEASDTASAARALATGELAPDTAVLASARAGARHGLALLVPDVTDEPSNRTYFGVWARAPRAAGSDVAGLRAHIQELDGELIRLLGRRFEEVRQLGRLKAASGLPIVDLAREAELRALYRAEAEARGLDADFVLTLFAIVLERSRREQAGPGRA